MELKFLIGPVITGLIALIGVIWARGKLEGKINERLNHMMTEEGVRKMLALYLLKTSHEQICAKETAEQETRNEKLRGDIVGVIHKVERNLLAAIKANSGG